MRKEAQLLADETFEKPFRKVHRQGPVLKFLLEDSITNFRFADGQGRVGYFANPLRRQSLPDEHVHDSPAKSRGGSGDDD